MGLEGFFAFFPRCFFSDDCRRAVRQAVQRGVDVIKIAATGGVTTNTAAGLGQQIDEGTVEHGRRDVAEDDGVILAQLFQGPRQGQVALLRALAGDGRDLVAVGGNFYTAAESLDPTGVVYDPTGFTVSVPITPR